MRKIDAAKAWVGGIIRTLGQSLDLSHMAMRFSQLWRGRVNPFLSRHKGLFVAITTTLVITIGVYLMWYNRIIFPKWDDAYLLIIAFPLAIWFLVGLIKVSRGEFRRKIGGRLLGIWDGVYRFWKSNRVAIVIWLLLLSWYFLAWWFEADKWYPWVVDWRFAAAVIGWLLIWFLRNPILALLRFLWARKKFTFLLFSYGGLVYYFLFGVQQIDKVQAVVASLIWAFLLMRWWPRSFHFLARQAKKGLWQKLVVRVIQIAGLWGLVSLTKLAYQKTGSVLVLVITATFCLGWVLLCWGPAKHPISDWPLKGQIKLPVAKRRGFFYLLGLVGMEIAAIGLAAWGTFAFRLPPLFLLLGLVLAYAIFAWWQNRYEQTDINWTTVTIDFDAGVLTFDDQFLGIGAPNMLQFGKMGNVGAVDLPNVIEDIAQSLFGWAQIRFDNIGGKEKFLWVLVGGARFPHEIPKEVDQLPKKWHTGRSAMVAMFTWCAKQKDPSAK